MINDAPAILWLMMLELAATAFYFKMFALVV